MKKSNIFIVICMLCNSIFSQTQITLTFMGKDSVSQNLIPLDSVYVINLTGDCDTLVFGPDPVLSLLVTMPVGIHEDNLNTSGAFIVNQNYPNPFRGSTIVSIYREYSGPLNFILFDGIGAKLAEYQNQFEQGFHSFSISSSGNKVLILTVFDNKNCRSIKIISAGQGNDHNAIQYLGHALDVEKGHLKSDDKSGFIFYLGNQLMYTAHSTGFNEQTIIDNPLTDSTYIFNMSMILNLAEVTTATVTDITQTTAISGGEVTSDGGGPVTARGVCWSIMPGPTTVNEHTIDGNGTGSFISNLTWLNPNTPYYIRAYATNSAGTAYGDELTFTTLVAGLPAVTTTAASYITQTTATSGGNVISDGGDFVFARGVCWSISPEPTISGDHTLDGGGIGNFESYLSGLTPNTPYYIRAYATNSAGTAYGDELTFTTLSATTPTVTTTPVTEITPATATSGGNVNSDGGAPVTERGVCWSNLQNPTISDNHTNDGSGTGSFVSYLTGLIQDTLYYVRAYAVNSQGTAYGNEESFTTLFGFTCGTSITINHVAGDVAPVTKTTTYGTVTNIPGEPSKCWITSNLGSDHQATAVDDATEPSAGWYWQFNRMQGYKHDGTIRTPNTTWITPIYEDSDWLLANDPCALELGDGWRIPTLDEWENVDAAGNWTNWNGPWDSDLKMHAAGYLNGNNGNLQSRGLGGYYPDSNQYNSNTNSYLGFANNQCFWSTGWKANGYIVRCVRE